MNGPPAASSPIRVSRRTRGLAYSVPHFGKARVLRGASWATRSRMKHPKFRGFSEPGEDEIFVGFRSCAI